ncbi:hypothetical protein B0J13DRAFT_519816 [Dactylonectria estremocensis]|uniref:Zn(2)-C6 fungal-type domain-containing protein n=1 Tax=Dactylonectria estremocensis TaxID=1079267 RepID=A0A9P9JIQ7_9HYPO|nr:hypothetical protein B0J13DRAFT_519816 [Dactylonectria estremocensis]
MPRLGYKKSRRGCLRCKQRRVKCDENRPCSACTRHGLECTYVESPSNPDRSVRSVSLTPSDSASAIMASQDMMHPVTSPLDPAQQHTLRNSDVSSAAEPTPPDLSWNGTSDPFPYFDKFVTGPGSTDQSPWLTDLELMHHYTSSTFTTLPRAAELQQIWQIEIPRLSMSHAFLLHQVLAVSAHHQSQLHPERYSHYSICASMHQNESIAGLRTALAQISEETCHEVFIASSMLSICAFAAFSSYGGVSERPHIDDLVDVFQLVRGMSKILDQYDDALHKGDLRSMFVQSGNCVPAPLLIAVNERLQHLKMPATTHATTASILEKSISDVITWVENAMRLTAWSELRLCVSFPICLTEEFMDLFRQHHPGALTLIAHYCLVLHYTGLDHWYLRGWGRSIIDDIAATIDPNWRYALEWPLTRMDNGLL